MVCFLYRALISAGATEAVRADPRTEPGAHHLPKRCAAPLACLQFSALVSHPTRIETSLAKRRGRPYLQSCSLQRA